MVVINALGIYPLPMKLEGGYCFGIVCPSIHPSIRPSVRPSVRPNFLSTLFLCNCWLDFNETLWEPSIPRRDAHIEGLMPEGTKRHFCVFE
jgi:hypothetical protein